MESLPVRFFGFDDIPVFVQRSSRVVVKICVVGLIENSAAELVIGVSVVAHLVPGFAELVGCMTDCITATGHDNGEHRKTEHKGRENSDHKTLPESTHFGTSPSLRNRKSCGFKNECAENIKTIFQDRLSRLGIAETKSEVSKSVKECGE